MNKQQLIKQIQSYFPDLKKVHVEQVLDGLAGSVADALAPSACDADAEAEVILPGIGKLVAKTKPARTGRNPLTGCAIEIPEKRAVTFRPLAALKKAVAG